MKNTVGFRNLMLGLVLVFAGQNCVENVEPGSFEPRHMEILKLINNTPCILICETWQLDNALIVRPRNSFPLTEKDREDFIHPEDTTSITYGDISYYELGDDVRFFIFEVNNDSAFYKNYFTLTDQEMQQLEYNVAIQQDKEGTFVTSHP